MTRHQQQENLRQENRKPGHRRHGGDDGSATTEYALVTLAAAGFAGLLVALLKSDEVRGWLAGLIGSALGQ